MAEPEEYFYTEWQRGGKIVGLNLLNIKYGAVIIYYFCSILYRIYVSLTLSACKEKEDFRNKAEIYYKRIRIN